MRLLSGLVDQLLSGTNARQTAVEVSCLVAMSRDAKIGILAYRVYRRK